MNWTNAILSIALLIVGLTIATARPQQSNTPSERLFDLSSLFNRYPTYQQRPYFGGNGIYQGGIGGGYPGAGYPQGGLGGGYPGSGLGTNILGGGYGGGYGSSGIGGGYGGYGGYGGNGGLQSYGGYNNNNYSGQRNLGFGYSRGTDSYGFGGPSRELNYYSGT
ncbi:keratin, type I cytoskeletal 10-like, partial [Sitodiplosis mosellana]|uniref:keratin, type I cytoskeletal 10-like n=1 Tax=Sitodiplosis mosellana TaxID=263140 RepID=UPI0024447683